MHHTIRNHLGRLRIAPIAATLLALGLTACSEAPNGEPQGAPAQPASSANARGPDYERWDQYLGGVHSSQYSSLDQINKSNVSRLEVAWTYPTGERGAYRFNPIVVDGVMYVLAHNNSLVALDAATGREIWRKPHQGLVGNRGISYWESEDGSDKRLLYVNAGALTAVDARTGEAITSFGDNGRVDLRVGLDRDPESLPTLRTDNPGRVFESLIIMSLPAAGIGYAAAPADIHAYDIVTGELRWVFHTVPRPGEFGADTWPADDPRRFGGVHNWSESTVDVERGLVFIPTGTARYDFYGANRPGDNLFGNSLIALDARTGERRWHFQTIHHDLWDYDLPVAPKLLTVRHNGREIPAVAQASKQGFLYVFNRETGEPLWPIEERPVPPSDVPGEEASPTQPFPTAPPPFARQSFTEADINPYIPEEDQQKLRELFKTARTGLYTPPSLEGTLMMPGHNGGANWGSVAVDPTRGRLYVVSKELPTNARLRVPEESGATRPSGASAGTAGPAQVPNADEDFIPYTAPVDFMLQSNGLSAIGPPWSQITAYDLNEGTILWRVPNGEVSFLVEQGIRNTGSHAPRGGPVVTAGGLLFVATSSDRKFRARDVDTGEVLWEFDLPAASEGVPAVYEVDGREYITIPVGGNGLFSQALPLPEPGPGQYMTFALPR
ncbi:MAG TPA: pyrroloquinoline quinone-dependent dehydrogenase [Gammaproteobacteria bacterium]